MADIQKIVDGLNKAKAIIEQWIPMFEQHNTPSAIDDAIDLLKEQDEQERKWLQRIAENQLANAPNDIDFGSLDEHLHNEYQRGIYDGLQMAYDILTET